MPFIHWPLLIHKKSQPRHWCRIASLAVFAIVCLHPQAGRSSDTSFLGGGRRALLSAPLVLGLPQVALADGGAEDARKRLEAAGTAIDKLLESFDGIKANKQGDLVRSAVMGQSSPIFAIQKAGASMISLAEDPEAFAEALDAYTAAGGQADGLAYSSGFANSGNFQVNNPGNYLEKARREVQVMQTNLSKMLKAL
eukprot:TRINITY_DN49717_c0_g1_i1.p1 TRINITY_DN49717_c0_g1~~TRINITY_DN49717_c0_g1_i1.p1  ORF type:complete len:196 (+),score=40.27 TRINITY_DN49717_c0_g1_i1:88-675(+)